MMSPLSGSHRPTMGGSSCPSWLGLSCLSTSSGRRERIRPPASSGVCSECVSSSLCAPRVAASSVRVCSGWRLPSGRSWRSWPRDYRAKRNAPAGEQPARSRLLGGEGEDGPRQSDPASPARVLRTFGRTSVVLGVMRHGRLCGAVLLGIAFFLPQYTCALYRGPHEATRQPPPQADASQYQKEWQSRYAWEGLEGDDLGSWLVVSAFWWPLPLLIYRRRLVKRRRWWLLSTLELGLTAESVYLIWALSEWGRRAVGAYVGLGGDGVYALALVGDLWFRHFGTTPQTDERTQGA